MGVGRGAEVVVEPAEEQAKLTADVSGGESVGDTATWARPDQCCSWGGTLAGESFYQLRQGITNGQGRQKSRRRNFNVPRIVAVVIAGKVGREPGIRLVEGSLHRVRLRLQSLPSSGLKSDGIAVGKHKDLPAGQVDVLG
jgi:hypothetical protein